jgi:hypothetical protein
MVAKELLPYVVTALEDIGQWDSTEGKKSAHILLTGSIQKPSFLVGLVMLEKISGLMRPVSVSLQAVGKDLVTALADVDNMLTVLKQFRSYTADEFTAIFQAACELADKVGLEKAVMEIKPRHGKRSVYRANAGQESQSAADYYRINVP